MLAKYSEVPRNTHPQQLRELGTLEKCQWWRLETKGTGFSEQIKVQALLTDFDRLSRSKVVGRNGTSTKYR